jgi:hypothetical protein
MHLLSPPSPKGEDDHFSPLGKVTPSPQDAVQGDGGRGRNEILNHLFKYL